MKLFYKAVRQDGKIVRGMIEAKDTQKAAMYLRGNNFTPIEITTENKNALFNELFKKKIQSKDLVFFTRQLSSMLMSGLTLMQSLAILRNQIQAGPMGEVVEKIIGDIEEGGSFSVAIEKYPNVFSPIYTSLIKAAESAGLLDKVLLRMADNLEKEAKLKATIKSALMYPIIVIILMVLVVMLMMIFVIPQLSVLYTNLNIPLPLATQIVVSLSNFLITGWPLLIVGVVGGSYYFRRWYKTDIGRYTVDAFTLKLPIFGVLIRNSLITEFTRTFGLLVGTGTLVVDALNKTADVLGNKLYKNAVLGVSKSVEKGISIGDAMGLNPLFPSIVVEMIKIGEQTGKLDDSLMRVSEYFEREVEQSVKTLTTAMEPIIMIVLAVGVGFLIFSIITPIYGLINSIQ